MIYYLLQINTKTYYDKKYIKVDHKIISKIVFLII